MEKKKLISDQIIKEIENQIKEGTNINEFKDNIHQIVSKKILEWLK